ncbi:hypothetical protein MPTK1_1g05490 [Marchantia polymorpha subsp. ruderalis]|uniref:Uncharacterized protein n=2 Tax=Marchantia polymorpha TaxID=3197 RepID=A0AAF6ALU3_MARPO|nr:hypothetical protein MARPO_0005s0058 [Marchantia polymorpha]BBM97413.1 hypothetical protein Mp_1g05490 [Marchantia polymorpha subsp. ruderalis]|eukprot:PTQ48390.1 hypothetical protein MARPO_0005s0058 [Marchantia polymorpha]
MISGGVVLNLQFDAQVANCTDGKKVEKEASERAFGRKRKEETKQRKSANGNVGEWPKSERETCIDGAREGARERHFARRERERERKKESEGPAEKEKEPAFEMCIPTLLRGSRRDVGAVVASTTEHSLGATCVARRPSRAGAGEAGRQALTSSERGPAEGGGGGGEESGDALKKKRQRQQHKERRGRRRRRRRRRRICSSRLCEGGDEREE